MGPEDRLTEMLAYLWQEEPDLIDTWLNAVGIDVPEGACGRSEPRLSISKRAASISCFRSPETRGSSSNRSLALGSGTSSWSATWSFSPSSQIFFELSFRSPRARSFGLMSLLPQPQPQPQPQTSDWSLHGGKTSPSRLQSRLRTLLRATLS